MPATAAVPLGTALTAWRHCRYAGKPYRHRVILTLGGLKGGVGKSTSAVFLATGLARSGRTLLVDADPQGSILGWSERAGAGFPAVIAWPVRDLGARVAQVAADYRHIVIDTGPAHEQLLRQALTVSDQLLLPVSPSLLDVREIGRAMQLVDDLGPIRLPLDVRLLLTRVRTGTASARDARTGLLEQRLPLLAAQVGMRELYAQAWGTTPTDLAEYDAVLAELQAPVPV